jgi:hypothetical protein
MTPAQGEATLCGAVVKLNEKGLAKEIFAIRRLGVLGI